MLAGATTPGIALLNTIDLISFVVIPATTKIAVFWSPPLCRTTPFCGKTDRFIDNEDKTLNYSTIKRLTIQFSST